MEILKNFLIYLSVEKGLSKNTVQSYQIDLNMFGDFIKSRGKEYNSFSKEDVIDYLEDACHGVVTHFLGNKAES